MSSRLIDQETQKQLQAIFREQARLQEDELFPGARLEHDCGITGDDAWELLEAIHEKFGTDFSSMDFAQHFHGEGEGLLSALLNPARERARKAYPVTVGHIYKVVEAGKWFMPEQVRKI